MKQRFALFMALLISIVLKGQVNVTFTVNDAITSTTCTDGLLGGGPDILWAVNVQNEGWLNYPAAGDCFTALPNLQYEQSYDCPNDVPNELEVCFKVFENDGIVLPPLACEIVEACPETICQNILLPTFGNMRADSLQIADGLESSGTLYYTVSVDGVDNDRICNAVPLGTLSGVEIIGDKDNIGFNNICGTNTGDPNPAFDGSINNTFSNDKGVWFTFNSGDDPSGLIAVNAVADPLNTGDPMVLQIAIYSTTNNTCSGFPRLRSVAIEQNMSGSVQTLLECPTANTNYYILVDGDAGSTETLFGHFGLEVENVDVQEAANRVCDADDLGAIPEGGQISTSNYSNFCAHRIGDPNVSGFTIERSVWFSFVAPSSGHVIIEGMGDDTYKALDVQLALFESTGSDCSGPLREIGSQYDDQDRDETLQLSCLFPGQTYYLLVDGGIDFDGIFSLTLSDAGDITPRTMIDTVLCAGESLAVGVSLYAETGSFIDTINLEGACDSIVFSEITVLPPLEVEVEQTKIAFGEGEANGIAELTITGGTGNYSIAWCNGETTATATALVGGDNCCVTVSDDNGCEMEVCLDVDFTDEIIPTVESDTLACFGDDDGVIRFSAMNGTVPYTYNWQKVDNSLSGDGSLNSDGEEVSLTGLTAGDYTIHISDDFDDTTFTVTVLQPDLVVINLLEQQNASCFGICDGVLEVEVSGGVPPYQLQWNTGATTSRIEGLCANVGDSYFLAVTDANGCGGIFSTVITEPLEFIVVAQEQKAVSCFGGLDGEATLSLQNGTAASILWSTGQGGEIAGGLPAGNYSVTVTNTEGCQGEGLVQITQPSAPVDVSIETLNPISCAGDQDGILKAIVSGPGESFTYTWSTGANLETTTDLGTGNYEVTIRNEKGCQAEAAFFLTEPTPLTATLGKKDLTCLDPPNGGEIYVEQVGGGTPDYVFAVDDGLFQSPTIFQQLEEGGYTVTIQDLAGCELKLPVEVLGPPVLTVDLGEDQTISLGDSILLSPVANSETVEYAWKDLDGIFADGDNIWLKPTFTRQYTIDAFDTETSCTASDQIIIQVDKSRKVFIPNVFDPGSVQGNERLQIYAGVGVVAIKSFRVFTRGGDQVFERINFLPNTLDAGWDGTFRNQPLNTGVYVYFAEIEFVDGLTEVFSGDVLLRR
ncbi:MAG: gliding motility-associated C-terminal domain-containing protein [Saprospiraceae bacterium]|nr:gliding motility-associated C-terminal domain-containing protein [Saprospiraceae bacterium]